MDRFEQKLLVFAQFATDLADLSKCKRRKVGCVVIPSDFSEVLAIGYNGPPKGLPNEMCSAETGDCGCVHAEANAIAKLSTRDKGLKLLCTTSPCHRCAGLIINCGRIDVVRYVTPYRDVYGIRLLELAGIKVGIIETP